MDQRFELTRSTTSRIVLDVAAETQLPAHVARLDPDGVVVVHDAALSSIATRIANTLDARAVLPIDGAASAKRLESVGDLADRLHQAGATRSTVMIAIGGGAITDLAGFVASIYLRGMPFVSCPTTTLAMCDAALGGKNGVNHCGLKNRLGTIRQPDAIIMDLAWLDSLTGEMYREGIVEVIKMASVLDAMRFSQLERLAPQLRVRDRRAMMATVEMAIDMKMKVVLADEFDSDQRRALNAGHTIGHAMESLAEDTLRHGHAVAIGLIAECRAANVDEGITERIASLLHKVGVSTEVPDRLADPAKLWALAQRDKKAMRGGLPMYVPMTLGNGAIVELTVESLGRALS